MKKLILLFALISVITHANEVYRTFTVEDGRTLEAKIIDYDDATGKVQIERADRKKITVPTSTFSNADQTYIKAWKTVQVFLSTSTFKLTIDRVEVKTSKKKHEVDLGNESGGGRGGESGTQVVATDKNTKYKYDLNFENKSDVSFKNVTMEYRIYYEQDKAVKDEKANKSWTEDDSRPERYMAVSQNKIKDGRGRVKTINPRENRTLSTASVTLVKRSASRPWGDKINLKSSLSGAWIKLTMKGPDRELIVREIASSASIMRKFSWELPEEVDSTGPDSD